VFDVRPYNPKFLWTIGLLHQLRDLDKDNCKGKLVQAKALLDSFVVENAALCGLNKVLDGANSLLLAFINPFLEDKDSAAELFNDPVGFDSWKRFLLMVLDQFENELAFDIDALKIFVLENKRGYSPDVLLSDIEQTLPPNDRGLLSDFARDNMQEAGACLAFHRFTACGYQMARAVEDVARRYNFAVTGHPSPYKDRNQETRHRPLAQIAEELQDVLNNWKHPEEPRLLSLIVPTLRNFCRIYRTPLSHADLELKELDANDAEIAFGLAVAAISSMLEDGRAGGPHFQYPCVWR
jgi:hypothetical protein